MTTTARRTQTVAALGATLALVLTACGDDGGGGTTSTGEDAGLEGATLTVGSKEFTESNVLMWITIGALQNAGADVSDASLAGSATVREALESGELDMYWEYTGTGWVNILGNTTVDLPDDLYAAVAEADAENEIAWLEPAPLDDTYRIAVTGDFAEENSLTNMTEAAEFINDNADDGTLCAASEFINRDDGLPGLQEAYGFEFSDVIELDLSLVYTEIGGSCQFGEVFSTDGRILGNNLTVLEDDGEFFPGYNAALTMRQETLDEFPAIEEVMAPIAEALTDEEITALNAAVDVDGETEEDVAMEWLEENGFVG